MEKMDHKVWFVWGCAFSMALGAGAMYLKNREKLEFFKKYPMILKAKDYMDNVSDRPLTGEVKEVDQINAYLALYGDDYTFAKDVDIKSEEYVTEQVNNSATALASGYEIGFDENAYLYFTKIVPDMPAAEQGIRRGDRIVSIDGKEVTEFVSAKELAGKDGTTVELVLERNGERIRIEFTRCADQYAAAGIKTEKYGDTLYISYKSFASGAGGAFEEALEGEKFGSLIIDLRGNGGGQTNEAVTLADLFVPAGEKVYCHDYSGANSGFQTTSDVTYDVPIVLLVNENTASSAEIFTALLKQYSDTTIVGTKTFGKGIYQEYGVLRGYSVQFTAGYYTVGDWESYHEKGIEPDIYVDMEPGLIGTELDVQLQTALDVIG